LSATPGQVRFLKVDVDEQRSLAGRFEIKSMPTFKAFRDGVCTQTFSGASEQQLRNLVAVELGAYEDATKISRGSKVLLHSLSKDEYNGVMGRIVGYTSDRYIVEFNVGEEKKKSGIKPENLRQILTLTVRDNGTEKKLIDATARWNESKQKYEVSNVSKKTTTTMTVSRGDLELPKGAKCRVRALTKAPQFNGQVVKVLEKSGGDEGRYAVRFGSSKSAKLKSENLDLM